MFEKEAEEYATRECCRTCNNVNHFCKEKCECWTFAKKGAEFGYNKANEWHYPSKNEYPKDDKNMLMSETLLLITKMNGSDCLSLALGQYNFSTQEFSYQHIVGLTNVIAWKEITLPEM